MSPPARSARRGRAPVRPPTPAWEHWPHSFVEELGAHAPELGIPRATMRVTAWMVVCTPPEQSAHDIATGVQLSAAAVSTAVRQLVAAGMLERVSRPGERRVLYRLQAGSWDAPLEAKLRGLTTLRQVADRAIEASGGRADDRLADMRDAFAWFEERLDEYVRTRRPGP
ncbi:MAG TPA: MarR family transcriptional regulator [Acidimicrobiales bacterium]|nr:MarR family transcriptional regulator [Acidimicrobiales bacterium]